MFRQILTDLINGALNRTFTVATNGWEVSVHVEGTPTHLTIGAAIAAAEAIMLGHTGELQVGDFLLDIVPPSAGDSPGAQLANALISHVEASVAGAAVVTRTAPAGAPSLTRDTVVLPPAVVHPDIVAPAAYFGQQQPQPPFGQPSSSGPAIPGSPSAPSSVPEHGRGVVAPDALNMPPQREIIPPDAPHADGVAPVIAPPPVTGVADAPGAVRPDGVPVSGAVSTPPAEATATTRF